MGLVGGLKPQTFICQFCRLEVQDQDANRCGSLAYKPTCGLGDCCPLAVSSYGGEINGERETETEWGDSLVSLLIRALILLGSGPHPYNLI